MSFLETNQDISPPNKANEYSDTLRGYGNLDGLVSSSIVNIQGEIAKPGFYILGGDYNFETIIDLAGGLKNNADLDNIKITSPNYNNDKTIKLNHDIFNYYEVAKNNILPGTYIKIPKLKNDLSLGVVQLRAK